MAGTWAIARAALKNQLNGVTWTASGHVAETLVCHEWPQIRQQKYPYAYIVPPSRTVRRGAGEQRVSLLSPSVRIVLGGQSAIDSPEKLVTRMEAAVAALIDALDDAVTLDGTVDVFAGQSFSGLTLFDEDQAWGFELTIEDVRITEVKTFSA